MATVTPAPAKITIEYTTKSQQTSATHPHVASQPQPMPGAVTAAEITTKVKNAVNEIRAQWGTQDKLSSFFATGMAKIGLAWLVGNPAETAAYEKAVTTIMKEYRVTREALETALRADQLESSLEVALNQATAALNASKEALTKGDIAYENLGNAIKTMNHDRQYTAVDDSNTYDAVFRPTCENAQTELTSSITECNAKETLTANDIVKLQNATKAAENASVKVIEFSKLWEPSEGIDCSYYRT